VVKCLISASLISLFIGWYHKCDVKISTFVCLIPTRNQNNMTIANKDNREVSKEGDIKSTSELKKWRDSCCSINCLSFSHLFYFYEEKNIKVRCFVSGRVNEINFLTEKCLISEIFVTIVIIFCDNEEENFLAHLTKQMPKTNFFFNLRSIIFFDKRVEECVMSHDKVTQIGFLVHYICHIININLCENLEF
jgi:hypothetical protein